MNVKYKTDSSNNFTSDEKEKFLKLLKLQNQVANPSIEKINSCPVLCLVTINNTPVAIGAIKQVYKRPFEYAKIEELESLYDYELGYLYVISDGTHNLQGQGIGRSICEKLILHLGQHNIFSTTEDSDKNPMKIILEKLGFARIGENYKGLNSGKTIGLFVRR